MRFANLGSLAILGASSVLSLPFSNAADSYKLHDSTPSPSDSVRFSQVSQLQSAQGQVPQGQQPAQAQQSAQGQVSRSQPAQVQPLVQPQAPVTAQPQNNRPNVASLGNNQFNSLTRSNFYASPAALAIGAGASGGRSSLSGYFTSAAHRNLLDTPEMFGDARRFGSSIGFDPFLLGGQSPTNENLDERGNRRSDFPSAASFSGLRVSENNMALPQDRFWVIYNHMHNAYAQAGGDLSLDRFTFGFEKTFNQGACSVEFRLPVVADIVPPDDFGGTTNYFGGNFGNLSVILKRVLYANNECVLSGGLAVEAPTGSRTGAVDNFNGQAAFAISPAAVYLTPFIGGMKTIDEIWFVNGFAQVEIATSGERLLVNLNGNPTQEFFVNKPSNLQLDFGGGVWLITPGAGRVGIAVATETHLTTAMSGDDTFVVDPTGSLPNVFVNQDTIRTILNQTTGVHAQFNNGWSLRTAISVPLLDDRIFDTEATVQATRSF